MARRTSPPFRADHVGSLLRPQRLLQAREDFAAGRISAADLRSVEDQEIPGAITMQEDVGLQSATDGEFRRASWHMDFIYALGGVSKAPGNLAVKFHNAAGDIEFTPASIRVDSKLKINDTIFADAFSFLKSHVTTAVPKLTIPSPNMVHYRGGPASVERSGGFEPLRFVPKGKMVVLGLVTTKRPELESKDDLKRRIDEAAKFVPLDQICLSGQCGFSSTFEGNALTYDEQVAKLRLIVETARDVWC